jgi:hypothetical protein
MKHARLISAPLALALCLAWSAHAASSASSASSTASTSIGSSSNSLEQSSDGSSQPNRTAQGDYRVDAVAAVADRPGYVRLTLQATAADDRFDLLLPQRTADVAGVAAVGQVVHAAPRDYGVEFARADTREAFFLVLQDEWFHELASHPVTL